MIEVSHLTLEHPTPGGPRRVLDDLSVSIADGEFVAIMGANGAGKTSFARCLNGLVLPTAGDIRIDGLPALDHQHLPAIRQRLGMVFQNPDNQIVSATVERDIAFGLENLGLPREEMRRRVQAMLTLFHLEKYRNHPPHLLSGGEKQRLAIAGVVAMQPRHLIFDEPTSLLDYPSRVELLKLAVTLNRGENAPASLSPHIPESVMQREAAAPLTILFITQFPEEALFARRLIVFDHGRIKLDGPPATIFQQIDELRAIGLRPPEEFSLWQRVQALQRQTRKVTFSSIEDLILNPII